MENCYHCGGELPQPTLHFSELGGKQRAFCCAGCQAIAETIHGQGLQAFYARRVPLGGKPEDFSGNIPERLLAYDDPVLTNRFVRVGEDGASEVTLRLEKIRCAACVWLNEQHLLRVPGVKSAIANYVTQRAVIRYDASRCKLSELLFAVEQIGYAAWPFEPSASNDMAKRERRQMLMRLGVAMLGMMQVMMYAWPTYSKDSDLINEHAALLGWASWLLTLPVIFYSAWPMFTAAWHSLRQFPRTRMLGMDVPVALALGFAFMAGTLNLLHGIRETYFDSMTMFVAFLLAARYVELRARQDAQSGAEALARQLPATCERLGDYPESRQAQTIPVVRCEVGDYLRVAPGEAIPVDGVVAEGETSTDEALLSGESRAVRKQAGDGVYAGSFNLESPLVMRVTAVGQATRLAGIASLLDQALQAKPKLAGLAERWAGIFVVVLLGMALLTGLVWWWLDSPRAWVYAVAVLVVSCPCALSLATPAALAAAQGAVTRLGLLVVRGHALETIARATDLVLDKTGTLTAGKLHLSAVHVVAPGLDESGVLAIAAGLEAGQKHPLALAVLDAASSRGVMAKNLGQTPLGIPGKGIQCGEWRLGSAGWLGVEELAADAATRLYLFREASLAAVLELADKPRNGARELIAAARSAGVRVRLLSGDHPATVAWWAREMGIADYQGGVLPEEKHAAIRALQAKGCVVWAVGDGVNDAPQLAQADVSVAVGSGAPLAQAGADAVLAAESLLPLVDTLRHARRTNRVVRQNLVWAFVYNVTAIPLAAFGLVNPWVAGIGMALSSLGVTLNAWRLRRVL